MKQIPIILLVTLTICALYVGCGGGDGVVTGNNPTPVTGSFVVSGVIYDYDGGLVGEGLPVTLYKHEEATTKQASLDTLVQTVRTDINSKYTFRVNEKGYFWIQSISKDGITPLYSHLFEIISQWLEIPVGFAPGPTGPIGPTGPPGSIGLTGPPGITGPVNLATLRVYVYKGSIGTGNEMSDAEVTMSWHGITNREIIEPLISLGSSGDGYYEFTDLPMGEYKIEINKEGYNTVTKILTISTLSPPPVNIVLSLPNMILVTGYSGGNFYIGKYEVTNEDYLLYESNHNGCWSNSDYPVEQVNWYEACDYCNWLSIKHDYTPAYDSDYNVISGANGYRLPYQDEWEYACKAGTTYDFFWGDIDTSISGQPENQSPGTIDTYCWYSYNCENGTPGYAHPHEVTSLNPNPLGLFHMSGNIWEWCNDISGSNRVIRGGGWTVGAVASQSSNINDFNPAERWKSVGFRIIRNQ